MFLGLPVFSVLSVFPSVPSPPSCLWTLGELPWLAVAPLAPLAHRSFVPTVRFSVINLQQLGHEDLLELERVNPPLLTAAQRSAPTNKRHVYASRDLFFYHAVTLVHQQMFLCTAETNEAATSLRLNQSETVSPTCNHITVEE